jgi:hypothetical protein
MMSKTVSINKKIETVCKIIAGKKVAPLAREANVERCSVYKWKEKAIVALGGSFNHRKEVRSQK